MTLDCNKMFLAVTQEAVVKGHFTFYYLEVFSPIGEFFYVLLGNPSPYTQLV